jgi:hypothetical protein
MPRPNWIDDPSISNDDDLWRGVEQKDVKEVEGKYVPSTGSFVTTEMSVSIVAETTQQLILAKGTANGHQWRLWEFPVVAARTPGCLVDRDPINAQDDPAKNDPAHAVVVHPQLVTNPRKRLTLGQAKSMVNAGRWADEPDEPE